MLISRRVAGAGEAKDPPNTTGADSTSRCVISIDVGSASGAGLRRSMWEPDFSRMASGTGDPYFS